MIGDVNVILGDREVKSVLSKCEVLGCNENGEKLFDLRMREMSMGNTFLEKDIPKFTCVTEVDCSKIFL